MPHDRQFGRVIQPAITGDRQGREYHFGPLGHDPADIVRFWTDAGPTMWFAKDKVFDRQFHDRFIAAHNAAANGHLDAWMDTATGALALVVLLDQFPRNAFRGTARMYRTDRQARVVAEMAIERGHDMVVDVALRLFLYLPFAHSENLLDQDRSVALNAGMPPPSPEHALRHHGIVQRFGRFPHRNPILGRTMTPDEAEFLASGGYEG
jgi:uncharacterized protein (DUF924 family)